MKFKFRNLMNMQKTILILVGVFLGSAAAQAAVKIYSAPEGIEGSGDFAVTVNEQNAFVFYQAENGLRKKFLPGGSSTPASTATPAPAP